MAIFFCGMYEMVFARSFKVNILASSLLIKTLPSYPLINPAIIFNSVDFPEPFFPIIPIISFAAAENETSDKMILSFLYAKRKSFTQQIEFMLIFPS